MSRVLRLTLQAPNIIEAIFDGRQPTAITLAVPARPVAVGWKEQQVAFGSYPRKSTGA